MKREGTVIESYSTKEGIDESRDVASSNLGEQAVQ